jgi:L-alanine-DL-glutamate epimerase-like enolase superfamily enzyme
LKLKVGAEAVLERVGAVRAAAPEARLIVDANEGWTFALLERLLDPLHALGVEMIEQPLPAGSDGTLAGFASPVVLCADESFHTQRDLDRMQRYGMVNVKLDKTGGLTAALPLAAAARARGLAVMVGCMVSTSLAMAPATLLGEGAAIVDLDGPLWLAHDRKPALHYERGVVHPPEPELWG